MNEKGNYNKGNSSRTTVKGEREEEKPLQESFYRMHLPGIPEC